MRRILLFVFAAVLAAEPRRIVSSAPSVTEMLFALGLGDRVVGVSTYCHYPPEVKKIAKIGTYLKPNLETILQLKPDLVIMQQTAVHSRQQFGSLRLNVLEVRHDTVGGIFESIEQIGAAAGVAEAARALNGSIRSQLRDVLQSVSGKKRSLVFIVGRTPGALEGMIAVGKGSYLSEVMKIAGGRNIFADSLAAYPKISHEEILARNPDVVIDMGEMADTTAVTEEQKRAVVALWRRYPALKAVKEGRVYAVASDIFVVPGPRVVELAREFARILHPR